MQTVVLIAESMLSQKSSNPFAVFDVDDFPDIEGISTTADSNQQDTKTE